MLIVNRSDLEVRVFTTHRWFSFWYLNGIVFLLIVFRIGLRIDMFPTQTQTD